MRLKWGHLCQQVKWEGPPLFSLGGLYSSFNLPESGQLSLKGQWLLLGIEAPTNDVKGGEGLRVALVDSKGVFLHTFLDQAMNWRPLYESDASISTSAFRLAEHWVISSPGLYGVVAGVDGKRVHGAVEFYALPTTGPLLPEHGQPEETHGIRVDWAHVCLNVTETNEAPGYFWLERVHDYYPILGDLVEKREATVVAQLTFGSREGPFHKMRVELAGPDGTVARFSERAFKAERFGLGHTFGTMQSAPFQALSVPLGKYAFQIIVDDQHLHTLDYPVVRLQELPPGWAKISSTS